MRVPNSDQVTPNVDGVERVGRWIAAVLDEGDAEAADEAVEATPRLTERAVAAVGVGRVAAAEVGAGGCVEFGLPEVVEVGEELDDIRTAAAGGAQCRAAASEVLPEVVPVAAFPELVAVGQRRPDHRRRERRAVVEPVGGGSGGGGGG